MNNLTHEDVILRLEHPEDYIETENVIREAFWNLNTPACDDHYMVHIMRDCKTFVPELDVVALHNNKIIGNIVYLKSIIKADDGRIHEVLSLGPLAVLPEYQGKGIGSLLVQHTLTLAREMGFRAVLLCGKSNVYTRQGFMPAEEFGIRMEDDMYFPALKVYGLYENALTDLHGKYYEDEVYNIDSAAAALFDKKFPPKKILTNTPSQIEFAKAFAIRKKPE